MKTDIFKRIFAFIATVAIITSMLSGIGAVVAAESENPFEFFDNQRSDILNGSYDSSATKPLPCPSEGEPYIVTFKGDRSKAAVALEGYDYRPLAYSERLVFLVYLANPDAFMRKNGDIILHFEKDAVRYTDTNSYGNYVGNERWELSCLNALNLPYDKIGDISGVTVALLDSGINRSHPAFKGANILDGYDITNSYAKVTSDLSGHGTRVAGIIAAQTKTTAAFGLAQSATILPIRISKNGKDIMTSDMIDGIYMAADAGADIINMSFGGYEKISAEEEAIEYAASKGCLLIAASGNEGNIRDFAGQYSYPASYNNVISVASVGQNDVICGFSQYNDMVDIAAPGEFLTLLGENGGIAYDNGTSFSAAYVTAAAALVDAYARRRISSAAFERLLEYSCGSAVKDNYSGYGTLNIKALIDNCRLPIVYGVSDGVTCFDRVSISFDGASATLDGEEFANGGSVFTHGMHCLIVTNSFGTRKVEFMLDTIRLKYTYHNFGTYCMFVFDRGVADIDGVPYDSGSHFSLGGEHVFTLHGPNGNTETKSFSLPTGLPRVNGVEDGKTYDSIVRITVSGNGSASLNGIGFTNEVYVTENGSYTLKLSDMSGTVTKTISFTVNAKQSFSTKLFAGNAGIFTSEEHGIAAFIKNGGKSVLFVPLNDLNSMGRVLSLPSKVLAVACIKNSLCVVHASGYVVYDAQTVFSGLPVPLDNYTHPSPFVSAVIIGSVIYYTDSDGVLYSLSTDTKKLIKLCDTGRNITKLIASGSNLLLYSPDNNGTLMFFNTASGRITKETNSLPCGEPISASQKYILCESGALDITSLTCIVQYPKTAFASAFGDNVITSRHVYSSERTQIGIFSEEVSGIAFGKANNYVLFSSGRLCIIPTAKYQQGTAQFFGAAVNVDGTEEVPYTFSPFETVLPTDGRKVMDIETVGDRLYVIYEGLNNIHVYNTHSLELVDIIHLKYIPIELATNGKDVAVRFIASNTLWTKKKGYFTLSGVISGLAYGDKRIYAIVNGRVHAIKDDFSDVDALFSSIAAEAITVSGRTLYVAAAFDISAFDTETLSLLASTTQVMGDVMCCAGDYLLVGGYILNKSNLQFVTACGSAAYTVSGGAVVCSRGIFAIDGEKYISHQYSGMSSAVRGSDNEIFIAYKDTIRRIGYYGDPVGDIGFSVSDGEAITKGKAISSRIGLLYLNSVRIENGFVPNSSGEYLLTAVLPWNISKTIKFSVKYEPEGISLRLSRQHLSPGKTAHVISSLLPQGAEGNITYSVEGDCISLEKGIITALSIGTARIIATVDGTDITAFCSVTVSGDSIVCTNPDYKFNLDNDYLSAVPPGTTVDKLLSSFECSAGSFYLVTPDGKNRKNGFVSTGCKLICHSGDAIIDSIDISVAGDLDGDGLVTVNDANILYITLRSEAKLEPIIFRAADVNQNGILTGADITILSGLVGRKPHASIKSAEHPEFDAPTVLGGSSTFSVTVTAGKLNGSSMMATLSYDSDVLEYLSASYYEGSVSAAASPGSLFFTALDIDAAHENRIIKVYFRVKNPSAGTAVIRLHSGEMYSDALYAISDAERTILLQPAADSLTAESNNSNLTFIPSVTKYSIAVLKNEVALNLSFTLPSGAQLYLPDLTVTKDVNEFMVKYVSPSGTAVDYEFIVTKVDRLPIADSAALLEDLSVTDYELDREFDSRVFLYELEVDCDCTEVRLDYDPINHGTSITVVSPEKLDYGNNIITIYCKAENGDTATYTLIVNRALPVEESSEPPESSEASEPHVSVEESSAPSQPPISDTSLPSGESDPTTVPLIVMCVVIVILLGVAVTMRIKFKSKNNE